jgi:serine/alanine adding enzyme
MPLPMHITAMPAAFPCIATASVAMTPPQAQTPSSTDTSPSPAESRPDEALPDLMAPDQILPALKYWRERKQQCARAFGPAKASGSDLGPLKAEMQAITLKLTELQSRLDAATPGRDEARTPPASTDVIVAADRPRAVDVQWVTPVNLEIAASPITDVPDWQAFVDAHPDATLYHDARWLHLMSDVFGHAHHALTARHAGKLVGVLPLLRQRSRLFGDFLTSLPFVNYGGALGMSQEVEDSLMREAGVLATRLGCRHVEFRDSTSRAGWPSRTSKVSMRLALPATDEELWRRIGAKLRAQVRRPEREGATTRVGGRDLVDAFYAVFSRNMRDLGTPVYSREWFSTLCDRFKDQVAVVVVFLGKEPVAAGLLLKHRRQVEIPWASTVRTYNRLSVNMLLYWRCICWAIEQQATVFDFGRSSIDAGTHRFKAQWGATEVPLHWHYWLPEGATLPELNPQNRKYQLAVRGWQRLPVAVSRWLGPHIVKYLP